MVLKIMLIAAVLHSAAEARPPVRRQANIGMKEVLKSPPSDGNIVLTNTLKNNIANSLETPICQRFGQSCLLLPVFLKKCIC